tara:strand:+ start:4586 stop:5410 length:825 start_codon:yes stop_codon:yes gene_type:complete
VAGVTLRVGARWDDPVQDDRIKAAYRRGLIDYIEVNYPIPFGSQPHALDIPVLAHTSSNPTCSAEGINLNIARRIKEAADETDSPWIGEHLSWLGTAPTGSLGYQINPLFTEEFAAVTAMNIRRLRDYYARPVALELGPIYIHSTEYESEMHFLAAIANDVDAKVILDVTHWQIGNRNLERPTDYGLSAIDPERIVELHIAGMRLGSDKRFWHDAHDLLPNEEVVSMVVKLVEELPALEALTFEHNPTAPEDDFFKFLEEMDKHVGSYRAPVAA